MLVKRPPVLTQFLDNACHFSCKYVFIKIIRSKFVDNFAQKKKANYMNMFKTLLYHRTSKCVFECILKKSSNRGLN